MQAKPAERASCETFAYDHVFCGYCRSLINIEWYTLDTVPAPPRHVISKTELDPPKPKAHFRDMRGMDVTMSLDAEGNVYKGAPDFRGEP